MPEVSGPNKPSTLNQPFGRYVLVRRLGVGGMAEAFLAQMEGPGGFKKLCVIKRMLPHLAEDEKYQQMFQREARVAALLTHTNVVQIFELGEVDGAAFIAMEYVDGAPVSVLARRAWHQGHSVPMEVVCCAVADAALGLAAAHALKDHDGAPLHLVHRDISPDNLMMNKEGVTKVLDFGVAKIAASEKTATNELKGKLPFLAPEYVLGRGLDSRSDLYALGVTFYWLVTGRRPFASPNGNDLALMEAIVKETPPPPRALNGKVPPSIEELILGLLERDPERRPQTGFEVHDALKDVLSRRRDVVVPFIEKTIAETSSVSAVARDAPQTPGFVPAVPHSDGLKSDWRRKIQRPPPSTIAEPFTLGSIEVSSVLSQPPSFPLPSSTNVPTNPGPQRGDTLVVDPHTLIAPNSQPVSDTPVDDDVAATKEDPKTDITSTVASSPRLLVPSAELTEAERAPKRGRALLAAAVAAAVVVIGGAVVISQMPGKAPPATAPPPPPPPPPAAPVTTPPPVEAPPVEEVEAPVEDEEPKAKARHVEPGVAVQLKAPAGIAWSFGGKGIGSGSTTTKLPAGAKSVTALDKKRGGKSTVPIEKGVADYGALAHGKIHPRARPYADVFLGTEKLGTTPFAPVDVVAGKYELRFVYEGKEEKRVVDVSAGETERPAVDFGAN